MQFKRTRRLVWVLQIAVCLLILKVTFNIVQNYPDYLPPDFSAVFLRGRKSEFFGSYQWAFYPHIAVGPLTLILGMLLVSDRFRKKFPGWHRRFGKLQILLVLGFLAPSGFWMAFYAQAGMGVKVGFALLALVTGWTAWQGWRTAIKRRFQSHCIWMWRCYVLLCSAVVTRLIGGTFTVTGVDGEWTYYLAAWGSWLVPLAVFEVSRLTRIRDVSVGHFTSGAFASMSLPKFPESNSPQHFERAGSVRTQN